MGSVGTELPGGVKLPTVKLDTTLADLYKRACPDRANTRLAWLSCGISSGIALTPDIPRNTRYLFQDEAVLTGSLHDLNTSNNDLQRSTAKKYLALISQRDAFLTGRAPVVFFHLHQSPPHQEHDRREVEATLSVLDPSQRPEPVFCANPSEIPTKELGIDRLQYKVAVDSLEGLPLTHDIDTHWLLNSKAGLAKSGLPTPPTDLIETEGCPPTADACCSACADTIRDDASRIPLIPLSCTGPRGEWLAAQTARILSAVRARPVPFVLKTQQAFGGAGTWLVTSEQAKTDLLASLSGTSPSSPSSSSSSSKQPNQTENQHQDQNQKQPKQKENNKDQGSGLLRRILSPLTPHNAHLRPTTLLLSQLIHTPPGCDFGLTFFVRPDGTAHFLAAAEQMLAGGDGDGGDESAACQWVGSTIHYARQEELRERFAGVVDKVAAWVARRGYVGPVGVDVLEVPPSPKGGAEGEEGGKSEREVYIVDLNVRTSGSVSLPLLRGHFFERRGMECASSFSITVQGGREEFMRRWRGVLEEGRMIIVSWYEDPEEGTSIADVVVGGEDEKRLQELMDAVRESSEEVTF